ncbi:MAG: hypothetical protein LC721_05725, partial [Actinobacteria bacterium]|nr:hypothetical protein [Actinomycetota bacterium]
MLPTSALPGMPWPALPDPQGALLLALQLQFQHSERLDPAETARRQLDDLTGLLRHSVESVPYYRDWSAYTDIASVPVLTADDWRRLPVLTRPAVQEAGDRLRSESVPADHLPTGEVVTTGSTGRPVRALTTNVTALMWLAITLREMLWHKRDLSGKFVALRADPAGNIPDAGQLLASWDARIAKAYPTGPSAMLSIRHGVETQAEWLVEQDPTYILTYPSNLMALADHFRAAGLKLANLRQVLT